MEMRTAVILDGLQDPGAAQALSRRWMEAGLPNALDAGAQSAMIDAPDETAIERAAGIASTFAVVLRDRVGERFLPHQTVAMLRQRMVLEYRGRTATALMFGLPALALHYLAPFLAGGHAGERGAMALPWLIELLLAGWLSIAAGWVLLYQGVLGARFLRAGADTLLAALVLVALATTAWGVLGLALGRDPWWMPDRQPPAHAAVYAVTLACLGRHVAHRRADFLAGRQGWMVPGWNRLAFGWLVISAVVAATAGLHMGLAIALLLPNVGSLGAINPWTPGPTALLPVPAFALFLGFAPTALGLSLQGIEVEVAAAFQTLMLLYFVLGWRSLPMVRG